MLTFFSTFFSVNRSSFLIFFSGVKNLYGEMDNYPEKVIPIVMVETLRKIFPRYAERGEGGGFVQQVRCGLVITTGQFFDLFLLCYNYILNFLSF